MDDRAIAAAAGHFAKAMSGISGPAEARYAYACYYLRALGLRQEAVAAAEKAYRGYPRHSMTWGIFAAVLARLGEKDRAAALVREGGEAPNPIWGRVLYHLFCSELDQAASWYERMIQQREPFAVIFASDSVLKPLRTSRHWPKLARLMNLPELSHTPQQ